MKKILAFILAALTVFSTVGYAAPTAEVTETGEEIAETGAFEVSSGDKAVLSEEEIDYNAPFYGVKVFFEDFENGYTDGESIIGKTTADGKATWALNGNNKISALAETDETTGNHYVRLVIPSGYVQDQTGLAAVLTTPAEGKSFTLYSDQFVSNDNASDYTYMGHIFYGPTGRANQTYNNTSAWKSVDSWYTRDTSVNVPWSGGKDTTVTKVMFSPRLTSAPADTTEVLVDNLGLYAKPAAPTLSYTVDVDLPTITIGVPEGVEPSAKAAIEAAPEKYFGTVGEFITNAAVSDTEIVLTVKLTEAAKEKLVTLSLPSLVSADGKTTSAAVTIVTDLDPKTADEIDYSKVHSGIRFKASVTAKQRGQAVEYGWIVTRKTVLGDNELTFKLDNGTRKTFVSAIAFGKTSDGKVIDKFISNTDDIVFTGVVTGIPEGMEDDVIVARPYIKYTESGDVFYGAAKESTLNAVILK